MKILVTGSLGTIGVPLTKALEEKGYDVWGLDLRHSFHKKYVRADVGSYRQLEQAIRIINPELVFHLAAEFGRMNGEEYYETLWKTNVIGTRNILEMQVKYGFELIFASSSEVYGETSRSLLLETDSDSLPMMQANDYAISKWVNEQQCMNFIEREDSQIMRLRFFNVYGPGEYYTDYRSVVCLFCYRALFGIPYNVYKNYHRVFMYVDDFIPTLVKAVERFTPGQVVNIGGAEYRSVEDLSDLVLHYTKASKKLVTVLPEDKHNVKNKRPDIEKAKTLLNHHPAISLELGIPRTIEWMKKIYNEKGELR